MARFNVFSFSNGGLSANVDWSTTSYDSGCKLNATLSITAIYGWYFTVNNGYSLTIKDTSGKVLKTISGNSAGVSGTGTFTLCTISNLDIPYYGDKDVVITANVNLSNIYFTSGGYYLSNYSKNQTCGLPNIPGASTITCTDAYVESSASIIVSKKVSTHTHTITYTFGSLSGTIVTKSSDTVIGFNLPSSFYNEMTNSKIKTGTLSCITYNSSGTQIGSVQTTTFNAIANEEKCKPNVSLTAVDNNQTTLNLTGDGNKFVKYFSNANLQLTATSKNGATIKSTKISCGDGKTSNSQSATFTGVESATFTGTVTDSRDFSNSVTLNKTLIEYIKLTCNVNAYRPEPTTGEIHLKVNGNYFNNTFGKIDNTINLRYRYKESTSSTWGEWIDLTVNKVDNGYNFDGSLGTNFDYTKSYDIEVNSHDKLMSLYPKVNVTQGIPVFDWGENDFNFNVKVAGPNLPISTNVDDATSFDNVSEELNKSGLYSVNVSDNWYNLINVRHRNGVGDGIYYGMQIRNFMTTNNQKLQLRQQVNNQWGNWRNIQEEPVVLYDGVDAGGTLETVTLSESASNFSYIEIFVTKDEDSGIWNVKTPSPNGRTVQVGTSYHVQNHATIGLQMIGKTVKIQDNKITHNTEFYMNFNKSTGSITNLGVQNTVKILKVIGYR